MATDDQYERLDGEAEAERPSRQDFDGKYHVLIQRVFAGELSREEALATVLGARSESRARGVTAASDEDLARAKRFDAVISAAAILRHEFGEDFDPGDEHRARMDRVIDGTLSFEEAGAQILARYSGREISPPPPGGFQSWLDYSVDSFDSSRARTEFVFDDKWRHVGHEDLASIVRTEYTELKNRASAAQRSILFVRHGQSSANAGGLTMEHQAIPLSELGLVQARELASLLPADPSEVWTSPFLRARDTAVPYCERFGVEARMLAELHEFDSIDPTLLEGMTGAERRPIADAYWNRADPDERMGARAETFREFEARVDAVRLNQLPNFADGSVVFGHGQWIAMLMWRLMGFGLANGQSMRAFRGYLMGVPMPNGAVYRFTEFAPGRWEVRAEHQIHTRLSSNIGR